VGELLPFPTIEKYPYLAPHPHLNRDKEKNTIFVARRTLSWDENKRGADCLNYKPELVLTKEGFSPSRWELPSCLNKKVKISYHTEKNWKDNYFQSAPIGQEFVIHADGNEEVEKWARDLICKKSESSN
jgi:hypothetical protein